MASRGEARQRKTTKCPSFDPSRRGTTTALLRKRHFTRASARIFRASASFTRSKIVFHRAALPRLVPGWQIVPFKIAASGARVLLAMTNLVGFAEKRNNFRNEKVSITAEFHCAASASAVPAGASTSRLSSTMSSVTSSVEAEVSASGGASRRRGRPSASKNSS